jgi:hypothetical protein
MNCPFLSLIELLREEIYDNGIPLTESVVSSGNTRVSKSSQAEVSRYNRITVRAKSSNKLGKSNQSQLQRPLVLQINICYFLTLKNWIP